MSEQFVAAIDQGTTSTRCMIFNHEGRVVAVDQTEHEQIFPKAGWVEHNAIEIWDNTRDVVGGALAKADLNRQGHRRGRHHQPARDRAGLGQDHRRAGLQRDRLAGHPHRRRSSTSSASSAAAGPVQGQGRPAAGHLLLRAQGQLDPRQRRGAREKAEAGDLVFGNMDTWVLWNMTGGVDGGLHVTDADQRLPHHADGPGHADLGRRHRRGHGHPAVDAAGDPVLLRGLRQGPGAGLLPGVPIAGILGDQQAATFGQACLSPGEAKNTYGTGNFMLHQHRHRGGAVEERPADHRLLQDRRPADRSTRSRARSRSPARWCSGSATTSA